MAEIVERSMRPVVVAITAGDAGTSVKPQRMVDGQSSQGSTITQGRLGGEMTIE
jgi:hypothetical protein